MSTWVTPATATGGSTALTASFWNAEVKTHLDWLKTSLNLLTASTISDVATDAYIDIRRPLAADPAFVTGANGAANPTFRIDRNGKLSWGAGGASALDTFFERLSATAMALSGGTALYIENVVNTVVFGLRVSGDSYPRVTGVLRSDGGGELRLGDSNYAYLMRSYYDNTNYQGIVAQADGTNGPETLKVITRSGGLSNLTLSTSQSSAGDWMQFYQNTKELRWLSGTTLTGSLTATTSTYIQTGSTFGLWGRQGVRTFTRAGTIADGNFDFIPSDGHTGVDTLHDLWYVRSGGSWYYADLAGDMVFIGPFSVSNMAASDTVDLSFGIFGGASQRPPITAGVATLDGSNPTPVAHGLGATPTAVQLTLNESTWPGTGDDVNNLSYVADATNINIYAWKYTSGTDPTLVASTNSTANIAWVAVGAATGTARLATGKSGSIVGIAVRGSANCTAGSCTFKPNIGGSTGTLTATINTVNVSQDMQWQDPGIDTFADTNQLGITATSNASFAPATSEYVAELFVLLRRV